MKSNGHKMVISTTARKIATIINLITIMRCTRMKQDVKSEELDRKKLIEPGMSAVDKIIKINSEIIVVVGKEDSVNT